MSLGNQYKMPFFLFTSYCYAHIYLSGIIPAFFCDKKITVINPEFQYTKYSVRLRV